MKCWIGKFGAEYTDRNTLSLDELDNLYVKYYGITRTTLNNKFLRGILTNSSPVLEVGCNIGNQLLLLQKSGFNNLYGLELQEYAIRLSQKRPNNISFVQGSVLDMPFKDSLFDLVFTSGLLIHINPINIKTALEEIYRCTKYYIWGFEYWSIEYTEVSYRDNNELLWKTDFASLYLENFNDLVLVRHEMIKYVGNDNIDSMFLLMKTT